MEQQDQTLLAAEYSLGLLTGGERRRAERRLTADETFRADVNMWQEGFAGLFDVPEIRPPPALRDAIETRLFDDHRSPLAVFIAAVMEPEYRGQVIVTMVAKAIVILALAMWLI